MSFELFKIAFDSFSLFFFGNFQYINFQLTTALIKKRFIASIQLIRMIIARKIAFNEMVKFFP